jgi:hypothetical protein
LSYLGWLEERKCIGVRGDGLYEWVVSDVSSILCAWIDCDCAHFLVDFTRASHDLEGDRQVDWGGYVARWECEGYFIIRVGERKCEVGVNNY